MGLIFGGTSRLYTMCILFVYSLLKVVRHYDLSVLSMNVMDTGGGGWWGELLLVLFFIFRICKDLKAGLRNIICAASYLQTSRSCSVCIPWAAVLGTIYNTSTMFQYSCLSI